MVKQNMTKKAKQLKAAQPGKMADRGTKRTRDVDAAPAKSDHDPRKRVKATGARKTEHTSNALLNRIPSQRLNLYVFGTATSGEFGLGAKPTEDLKDPTLVPRPRANGLLAGNKAMGCGIVQISVGAIHCAALTANGRVMTWGANDTYNLGRDTEWEPESEEEDEDGPELNPLESTPTVIPAADFRDGGDKVRFVQVVALDNATFALAEDGRLWGWGTFRGNEGIFGFLKHKLPTTGKPKDEQMMETRPVLIPGVTNGKVLAGGSNHVLLLTHDGEVYGWGAGAQSELGRVFRDTRSSTKYDSLAPARIALPRHKTVKIFAGSHQSFAIDDKGRVFAWGPNNFTQTGIPPTSAERIGFGAVTIPLPKIVKALEKYEIVHLASGKDHTVACTEDGKVLVWGRCSDGQMGQPIDLITPAHVLDDARGRPQEVSVPTVVPSVTAKYVAAGIDCCMAVSPTGQIFAWGYSEGYRTGLGTDDMVEAPRPLEKAVPGKVLNWAAFGGQFGMVAGPSDVVSGNES